MLNDDVAQFTLPSPCWICERPSRGFGWADPKYAVGDPRRLKTAVWFCSRTCQLCHKRNGGMLEPSQRERGAIDAAVDAAGAYIEKIGRTDLLTWLPCQFDGLVETIAITYAKALREASVRMVAGDQQFEKELVLDDVDDVPLDLPKE